MPLGPFQSEFAHRRVVTVPSDFDEEARARFATKIAAAVKLQSQFAEKSDCVLRVDGEIERRGDQIIIPHEPAAPGDPESLERETDERPDINTLCWITWSALRALAAAGPGAPHGAVQIETLYLDQSGRVKLGDFGVATAYEAVCGGDRRRQLHCDGAVKTIGGKPCSGVWSMLEEDTPRDQGWIAPYFAHELLDGSTRLNPKSDQFALGTLLFLMATGAHPYGVSLSDPSVALYFHLEPFLLEDERTEWREVFERREGQLTQAADKPVLVWSDVVRRLLASEPGERFANAAEAFTEISAHCPKEWELAAAAMSAGARLLDQADPDGLLKSTAPWRSAEALPAIWRDQLGAWLADVEARADEIGAHKQLSLRLAEAQAALNSVDTQRARELASEVLSAAQSDDAQRASAQELIALCDEQEQFVESGADDLAKAYLQSARECVDQNDRPRARALLDGLLADPATPGARAAQARELISEIELIEQKIEQQEAELSGAGDDLDKGRFAAARQRIEALLKEELAGEFADRAGELLTRVGEAEELQAAYLRNLEAARGAWERGDSNELEASLSEVPEEFSDQKIVAARTELAALCDPLKRALAIKVDAEEAEAAGEFERAVERAQAAAKIGKLPEVLSDALKELAARCGEKIEQNRQERIDKLGEMLTEARQACDTLDVDKCRQLAESVKKSPVAPDDLRVSADKLLAACGRVERALAVIEHARGHLADNSFANALTLLDKVDQSGLPADAVKQLTHLRDEVEEKQTAYAESQRNRLREDLATAKREIGAGALREASARMAAALSSDYLDDDLRNEIKRTQAESDGLLPILEAVEAAEKAVSGDSPNLNAARAALTRVGDGPPAWASARVDAARTLADDISALRRQETIRQATEQLDAAEQRLADGNLTAAHAELSKAANALKVDKSLAARHAQLTTAADRLKEWLPKTESLSATLARSDLLAATQLAEQLLADDPPEPCKRQISDMRSTAETGIADHRRSLDEQLGDWTARLGRRGRRFRRLPTHVAELNQDPLATKAQKTRANELAAKFDSLPEEKTSKTPLYAAAAVAVVALAAIGLYFGGVFGGGSSEPKPRPNDTPVVTHPDDTDNTTPEVVTKPDDNDSSPPKVVTKPDDNEVDTTPTETDTPGETTPVVKGESDQPEVETTKVDTPTEPAEPVEEKDDREIIAAALQRLEGELRQAASDAARRERVVSAWTIESDSSDKLPATFQLINPDDGASVKLGTASTPDELAALRITSQIADELFPAPPEPPKPTPAEIAQDYLSRLRELLADSEIMPAFQLADEKATSATPTARWRGIDLLPFGPVTFDAERQQFLPEPAGVAAHFRVQSTMLAALEQPFRIAKLADGAAAPTAVARYEFVIGAALGDVELISVDPATDRVEARTAARIGNDPRANTSFSLHVSYSESAFGFSDDDALAANNEYERSLQQSALATSVDAIERALDLPAGLRLNATDDFAGGESAPLRVTAAEGVVLAESDAAWNADTLSYDLNVADTLAKLRAGVRDLAGQPAARDALSEQWPDLRGKFAPTDGPGATYFERCALKDIRLTDAQPDSPFAAAIVLSVAPPAAISEEDSIRIPGELRFQDGRLAWDSGGEQAAREAVAQRLREFAGDSEFRRRRGVDALRAMAPVDGVRPDGDSIQLSGDEMSVSVGAGDAKRDFVFEWDPATLAFGPAKDVTPPPKPPVETPPKPPVETPPKPPVETPPTQPPVTSSLDQRLAQLASSPSADATAFCGALAEVTRVKAQRYGAAGYQARNSLSTGGPAALVDISRALRNLVAPSPGRDPIPTVFVEYYDTGAAVYGLGWRVNADANGDITGVAGASVWRAMDGARLSSFASPTALRSALASDAGLGEALLGPALGGTLTGSAGGAFGLMVAPDGPLWLARWDQVAFRPRPVSGVELARGNDVKSASSLRDVLRPTSRARGQKNWPKAGIWCVPALAGVWGGGGDPPPFDVGVLAAGEKAQSLDFKTRAGGLRAGVADLTKTGFVGFSVIQDASLEDLGRQFWDHGWTERGWMPTFYPSFALLPTR